MDSKLISPFTLPRNDVKAWKEKCSYFSSEIDKLFSTLDYDPIKHLCQDWDKTVSFPKHLDSRKYRKYFISLLKILSSIKSHMLTAAMYGRCNSCHKCKKNCFCLITIDSISGITICKSEVNTFNGKKVPIKSTQNGWVTSCVDFDNVCTRVACAVISLENTRFSTKLRNVLSIGYRNNSPASNTDTFITYCIFRPFCRQFYIGRSKNDVTTRRYTHYNKCLHGAPQRVYKTLRTSGLGNWFMLPVVRSTSQETVDAITYLESQQIKMFKPPLNTQSINGISFFDCLTSNKNKKHRPFAKQIRKQRMMSSNFSQVNNNTFMIGVNHGTDYLTIENRKGIPSTEDWRLHFANPLNDFRKKKVSLASIPFRCRLDAAYVSLSRRAYTPEKVSSAKYFLSHIVSLKDIGFIYRHTYKFAPAKDCRTLKNNIKLLYPDSNIQKEIFGEVIFQDIKLPLSNIPEVKNNFVKYIKTILVKIGRKFSFPLILKLRIKNDKNPNLHEMLVNCTKFCNTHEDKLPTKCHCGDPAFNSFDRIGGHIIQRVSQVDSNLSGLPPTFNSKCRLLPSYSYVFNKLSSSLNCVFSKISKIVKNDRYTCDFAKILKSSPEIVDGILGDNLSPTNLLCSFRKALDFKKLIKDFIVCPIDKSKGDLCILCPLHYKKQVERFYHSDAYTIIPPHKIKERKKGFFDLHRKCQSPKLIQQERSLKSHKFGIATLWVKNKNWSYDPVLQFWSPITKNWNDLRWRPLSGYSNHFYRKSLSLACKCINAIIRSQQMTCSFVSLSVREHFERVHNFNLSVQKYIDKHGADSLGLPSFKCRDIKDFFNNMNRQEALDGLRRKISNIKLKHKARYIGIPNCKGSVYHTLQSGDRLDQNPGSIRKNGIPGKQRFIFTNKCNYSEYEFLDLDDIPKIIEHDFSFALFESFGSLIYQEEGSVQGSPGSPGISSSWACDREEDWDRTVPPVIKDFPRFLSRFFDDIDAHLFENDPLFHLINTEDFYGVRCKVEDTKLNEMIGQRSLWICNKLSFFSLSPNRDSIIHHRNLKFNRLINGNAFSSKHKNVSTCICILVYTIDGTSASCPNFILQGAIGITLIELFLHDIPALTISEALSKVKRKVPDTDLSLVSCRWDSFVRKGCVVDNSCSLIYNEAVLSTELNSDNYMFLSNVCDIINSQTHPNNITTTQ